MHLHFISSLKPEMAKVVEIGTVLVENKNISFYILRSLYIQ